MVGIKKMKRNSLVVKRLKMYKFIIKYSDLNPLLKRHPHEGHRAQGVEIFIRIVL